MNAMKFLDGQFVIITLVKLKSPVDTKLTAISDFTLWVKSYGQIL